MPEPAARSRARRFWRSVGLLFALALGIGAVVVVVLAHSQKQQTVGLLLGLWAALVGFFLGPRRQHAAAAAEVASGNTVTAAVESRELELRRAHELELERVAAGRREYELTLRRELERLVRQELSELRKEIAGLRGDLEEKVSGQLKLERIETTRLIGSDLEALQDEVRRLAARDAAAARPVINAAPVPAPVSPPAVAAPPVSAPPAVAATPAVAAPAATPPVAAPPPAAVESEPPPRLNPDPLADLPQLGPFVDVDEPLRGEPAPAPGARPRVDGYVGRRRVLDPAEVDGDDRPVPVADGGGRRRRADDEPNEVLARLLGSTGARRDG